MRLRNKKTGEIIELLAKPSFVKRNDDYLQSEVNTFNSLAELNEEWEDYEEPKGHWTIGHDGAIFKLSEWENQKDHEEIGNYFETREEAEEAVEKLKAWKRLKDKGFRFNCWYGGSKDIAFSIPQEIIGKTTVYDLDLLFGGEE